MKFKIIRLFVLVTGLMIVLSGCTAGRKTVIYPEPRALGKELADINKQKDLSLIKAEPVTGDLTLPKALSLALMRNPELAVFSLEIRAREAAALQASLLPNPELEMEAENFAGSGPFSSFRSSETTISLGQLIELGGKREKRTQVADLESGLAAWDYEAVRLNVFTDVVKSFIDVLAAQQRVSLNEEMVRIAERFLQSVRQRVKVGKVSEAEASRASVELSAAQIELEHTRRALDAARKRLASYWGSAEPSFQKVIGQLDTTFQLPDLKKLQLFLRQNPDIARWSAEIQKRQAVLELEKAYRIPDPTVSGGLRRFGESGDNAFVMSVSLPLPVLDRNQGNIREAQYRLQQTNLKKRVAEINVKTLLADEYNQLIAAFNEIRILKTRSLPEAQKAFEMINNGYLMGRYDLLDVLDAQRTLFEARSQYLDALRNYHRRVANLERLVGQKISNLE
ncbi:MAG: TolC family protein [Calditrichaeota bacterium]|nr:TolC family protein [Calditrichota bacterium]